MTYRNRLLQRIREIKEGFEARYQNPSTASTYFREQILGLPWEKRINKYPKYFKGLLADLRMVGRTSSGTIYNQEQMKAISHALELCERDEVLFEEYAKAVARIEESGIRIGLELDLAPEDAAFKHQE